MKPHPPRPVDWPTIEGTSAKRPRVAVSMAGRLERLVLLAHRLRGDMPLDEMCTGIVRAAREQLRLDRAAIYLLGEGGRHFWGVVGTDARGQLVSETHLRHAVDQTDRVLFDDCLAGRRAYEIINDVPLVTHEGEATRVMGHGWLGKTPIVCGEGFGLLYNDSLLSSVSSDPLTQEMLAAFVGLVSPKLKEAWRRSLDLSGTSHLVAQALELLFAEPGQSLTEVAERLKVSPRHLGSLIQTETGKSFPEVRNDRRIERALASIERYRQLGQNVPVTDIAFEAGFGSYSQFHRVFSAAMGQPPRSFIAARRRG